ncbi:MAG: Abi family protein [Gammaproteobacteria bacterium]|nr:Abi family protein [Gammaproteobacteria bacterium]
MKRYYTKPALSFDQQSDQLIIRGMVFDNKTFAIKQLSSISYYRLSAYWYPFRQRNELGKVLDPFIPKTNFQNVMNLYDFDRQLRLLMLDAIERIEVAIRTQVTYHMSHTYGAFCHSNPQNFHPKFNHGVWLNNIEDEAKRSSEEFIRHYKDKYDGFPKLPLWMLTEIMSLGSLSRLYGGMQHSDKKIVSGHFNIHHKRLANWLHTLTYIRNVCAHHSRLWNRELAIRPDEVKQKEWLPPLTPRNDRIFYILLMLHHLLKATDSANAWTKQVNRLIRPLASAISYRVAMGMPEEWERHPIWIT